MRRSRTRCQSCAARIEQFGKNRLVEWDRVRDIQAVTSPRVEKNTTPALSEAEARRLLHAPDTSTLIGLRDHVRCCSCFSRRLAGAVPWPAPASATWNGPTLTTTCLCARRATSGSEKRVLEAAPAVLTYVEAAGIRDDHDGPLFRAAAKDRRTLLRKSLDRRTIWGIVKKYAHRSAFIRSGWAAAASACMLAQDGDHERAGARG